MAKSRVLVKQHQAHIKWYLVLILVCAIAAAGIALLYYSHAGTLGKIAYSISVSNNQLANQVYTVNPDSTQNTQVTHTLAGNWGVMWSPDHTKLAMVASPGGAQNIFVQNADGTGRKQITSGGNANTGSTDSDPAWSPNGSKIVFFHSDALNSAIYTVNPDGTGLFKVKAMPNTTVGYESQAVWSPDSTKLLFQNLSNTVSVIGSNGTGEKVLSADANSHPIVFSPKGTQVVYGTTTSGYNMMNLKIMGADGSSPRQLVANVYWQRQGVNPYSADGYSIAFINSTRKTIQRINPFSNAITTVFTKPAGDNGYFYSVQYPKGDSSEILTQETVATSATNNTQLSTYSALGGKISTATIIPSGAYISGLDW